VHEKSRQQRFDAARYAPELSWPILDTLGTPACAEAVKQSAHRLKSPIEQARLYGDLICALNGTDQLPWIAGLLWAELLNVSELR
jgi:hypothetical protein